MGKIFYVSDYHFYHELALKRSRNQYFNSVDEMNEAIIRRHNEKIDDNDHVYILGDIIVCDEEDLEIKLKKTVGKLKGHLHLITGNHDYKFINNPVFLQYFDTINESKLVRDGNKWVQLYHYPVLLWYRKNKGSYHVFGHVHDEKFSEEFSIIKKQTHALNACVEINNFEPNTLKSLIYNNELFYQSEKAKL